MFFKLVCLCSVAACALGAPAAPEVVPLEKQQPTVIPIVSHSEELEANGTFKFSYETGNGIKREEISYDKVLPKAESRSANSEEGGESDSDESNEIHVQQGSYSYTAPDGTVITVRYIADENGFRAFGDHLPTVPPLTQQIAGRSSDKSVEADSADSGSAPVAVAAKPLSAIVPAPVEPKAEVAPVSVPVENASAESSSEPNASAEEASSTAAVAKESVTEASAGEEASSSQATSSEPSTVAPEESSSEASSSAAPESASEAPKDATTEAASSSEPASNDATSPAL